MPSRFSSASTWAQMIGELGFDHGGRQREAVGGVQRIQDAALQMQAAGGVVVVFDLVAHPVLEGGQIVQAQLLGQLVVDLGFFRRLDLFDGDGEDRVFAGQFGGMIFGGEGHLDIALLAGLGADQLVLEAGNELARAQGQIEILALAAIEFHAIDAADKIDHARYRPSAAASPSGRA